MQNIIGLARIVFPLGFALWFVGCAENIIIQPPEGGEVAVVFDLSAKPSPRVPTPTDLALDRTTGLLNVPVADEETNPAQAAFDKHLNTLDGYPIESTVTVPFSGEIDETTFNKDTVKAFTLDLSDPQKPRVTPVDESTLSFSYSYSGKTDPKTKKVSIESIGKIVKQGKWERNTTYVFFILSGTTGVKDKNGKPVTRSATFEMVASPAPLCAWDETKSWDSGNRACSAPSLGTAATGCCIHNYSTLLASQVKKEVTEATLGNPAYADKTKEELDELINDAIATAVLESATDLELLRSATNSYLNIAEAYGLARKDIAVTWAFSTLSMAQVEFDPTLGKVPFPPGDLVMENGKVNLPEQPNETPEDAALRLGLNSLDGFSTTGANYITLSGDTLDENTVTNTTALFALNFSTAPPTTAPMTFEYHKSDNTIIGTPTVPLRENTKYVIVMVSKIKENQQKAAGGLTDIQGRHVVPSLVFALARMDTALVKNGISTVSVLDNTTAAALETLRINLNSLFLVLATKGINREDVVMAWSFTTQTITAPLLNLRAMSWSMLSSLDQQAPAFVGTNDPSLTGIPPTVPTDNIGSWVPDGEFTTWNALDQNPESSSYGAFLPNPANGKEEKIPFFMTIPKNKAPTNGYPVVVFQHGLTRGKSDFLALANTLATSSTRFATIAFDIIYHGARSFCTSDDHCNANYNCNTTTGQCCDTSECKTSFFKDTDADGVPDVSGGSKFFNMKNPFAFRDSARQHVIDTVALLRAIKLGAHKNLTGAPIPLDTETVYFVGHSLGAMLGSIVLATDSLPKKAVLNVPGGPWSQIMTQTEHPNFKAILDGELKARNISAGSIEAIRLFSTLQWILDPADPVNFASFLHPLGEPLADLVTASDGSKLVTPKQIILQVAGQDLVIPNSLQQSLANIMGANTQKTTYAEADHGFLLDATNPPLVGAAQGQLLQFLLTGGVCTPDTTNGTCNF
ncbi:MAG: alpha/beta fold hydrolase [Pseudomonadota bacterium]